MGREYSKLKAFCIFEVRLFWHKVLLTEQSDNPAQGFFLSVTGPP